MNERYLFRGKRLDNGEWVEGSLVDKSKWHDCYEIVVYNDAKAEESYTTYEIDPSTIGRCTGIQDMNGALIFEGDIVKCNSGVFVIKSKRTYNCLYIKYVINGDWDGLDEFIASRYTDYGCKEIIGNTHDNPELLEG